MHPECLQREHRVMQRLTTCSLIETHHFIQYGLEFTLIFLWKGYQLFRLECRNAFIQRSEPELSHLLNEFLSLVYCVPRRCCLQIAKLLEFCREVLLVVIQ